MSGSYELHGKQKGSSAPPSQFSNGNKTSGTNGKEVTVPPSAYTNGNQQPQQPPIQVQPAPMVSSSFMSSNTVVVNQSGSDGSKDRLVLVRKSQLKNREWNSGICGCCNDLAGCVFGSFCFPCLLIRLANRLNECALVTCCVPGGMVTLRTQLRVMGGIKGSICQDCIESCCCLPCVACQMAREMNDMQL